MKKIIAYLKIENIIIAIRYIILITISITPFFTYTNIAYPSLIFKNTLRVPIGKTTIERLASLKPKHVTPEDIASIIQEGMIKNGVNMPIWYIGSSATMGFSVDDFYPCNAYRRDIDLVFPDKDHSIKGFVESLEKSIEDLLSLKTKIQYMSWKPYLQELERNAKIILEEAKPNMIDVLYIQEFFLSSSSSFFEAFPLGFDISKPTPSSTNKASYLIPFKNRGYSYIYRISPSQIRRYSQQDTKLVYLQLFLDLSNHDTASIVQRISSNENSLFNRAKTNIIQELKSVIVVNGCI